MTTTHRAKDAGDIATVLKAAVPTATEVVVYTEDNDPNDLIGRTNGYVSAALLKDSGSDQCEGLGMDCGAVVEVFEDGDAAKRRSKFIQGILKDAPVFGSETDFRNGNKLLRVSGVLKPSQVKKYEAAWKDAS